MCVAPLRIVAHLLILKQVEEVWSDSEGYPTGHRQVCGVWYKEHCKGQFNIHSVGRPGGKSRQESFKGKASFPTIHHVSRLWICSWSVLLE